MAMNSILIKANAKQLVSKLISWEFRVEDADAKRMIRNERMQLQSAICTGNVTSIASHLLESTRVARMWGADV